MTDWALIQEIEMLEEENSLLRMVIPHVTDGRFTADSAIQHYEDYLEENSFMDEVDDSPEAQQAREKWRQALVSVKAYGKGNLTT